MARVQDLSPDILILSVGPEVLKCLPFRKWKTLYEVQKTTLHKVKWTTKVIGCKQVLVVNALPNNYAFGNFTYEESVHIGNAISRKWQELTHQ